MGVELNKKTKLIEGRGVRKKDYKKIIDFTIEGMHLKKYFGDNEKSKLLKIYGRYFLYLELIKATHIYCAYDEDVLLGIMIIEMNNEKKLYHSLYKKAYVKFIEFIISVFFKGANTYDEANREMLDKYLEENHADGEIIFLASDTGIKRRGVGTFLLQAAEKELNGKKVYVYTDDMCTYQYYEHRGFHKVGEKDILLDLETKVPLKCFLYKKTL